jgi:hypothetical protein
MQQRRCRESERMTGAGSQARQIWPIRRHPLAARFTRPRRSGARSGGRAGLAGRPTHAAGGRSDHRAIVMSRLYKRVLNHGEIRRELR